VTMRARQASWRLTLRPGHPHARPPVRPGGDVARVVVVAETAGWLRRYLAEPADLRVRRLDLRVRHWAAPQGGWSGRLGPIPGVTHHRVTLPRRRPGAARVEIEVVDAVDLRIALSAALGCLQPAPDPRAAASPDVTAVGDPPPWLPVGPGYAVSDRPPTDGDQIRTTDLVITPPGHPVTVRRAAAATVVRGPGVVVDTSAANPIGRHRFLEPDAPTARLGLDVAESQSWWRLLEADGSQTHRGPVDGHPLPTDALALARRRAALRLDALPGRAPVAEAVLLAQLAATGAVLHVPPLPAPVADLLAPALREILAEPWPDADAFAREARSVRQRRAALRGHGVTARLAGLVAQVFPTLGGPPPVSVIVVTRRPRFLPDVVRQLTAQTYPRLEVVVGLHGADLDGPARAALAGCELPVDVTVLPGGLSFGEALGETTARARGSLVTKVDDDDDYGPEHVWDLVLAREYSGATLVGKAAEFVHLRALGVTVRRLALRPEQYGPPVAGGTMLIARGDLEAVGGWRPLPRSVDLGLIDRVVGGGGLVYRTHPLGYVYERRTDGHTWDAELGYFLRRSGQQWTGLPDGLEFHADEPRAVHSGG
jgi:hypothetical protein